MFSKLFFLFLFIPFFEVAILVKLASVIGFWDTVLIQIATAFIGASLAKYQGLKVWLGIQSQLSQGMMPEDALIDGLMILIAGLVLLTPGLLTDFFGFLLLVPFTRTLFKNWMKRRFENMRTHGQTASIKTILIE